MSKICVCGFGSLINNPGSLKVILPWKDTGPIIKIQYSRISSQTGKLVLAIDERNGQLNQIFHSQSRYNNLEQAITNFQERENVERNKIGVIDIANRTISSSMRERHPESARAILEWGTQTDYNYILITDLGIRFRDAIDVPWSVSACLDYIQGLEREKQLECIKYITNVPSNIVTDFTRAFNSRFQISFSESEE